LFGQGEYFCHYPIQIFALLTHSLTHSLSLSLSLSIFPKANDYLKFLEYAGSHFAHENLEFMHEVGKFEQLLTEETDASKHREQGEKIFHLYIAANSEFELNLGPRSKQPVFAAHEDGVYDKFTFTRAKAEALKLLALDVYPHYIR